jgi:CheY-like chemotaxis protein
MAGADQHAADVHGAGETTLDHASNRTGFGGAPLEADPARDVQKAGLMSLIAERPEAAAQPLVGVVEDDPSVAALAAELCRGMGANAVLFASPTPFLRAISDGAPRAVVLDWRLEREVSSAAFLAIRHRYPQLPVVCWTASPRESLPVMIHHDPLTRIVDKALGLAAFEHALSWALGAGGLTNRPG